MNCVQMWLSLPNDPKDLILEFKAGMELVEIIETDVNQPNHAYGVTPFSDINNWNISDDPSLTDTQLFADHIFHSLECRLELCANCLGTNLNDLAHTVYQTHWMSGKSYIDKRVAIHTFQWFLSVLKKEIREHECKEMGLPVPTKLDWWTRTFSNEYYYSTIDALKDLSGMESLVLKTVLKSFTFE